MLTVEEALARCLAASMAVVPEQVVLAQAAGRVLAQDVAAMGQLPPWDNSAMDGYAVIAADTAGDDQGDCDAHSEPDGRTPLRVLETIAAGAVGRHRVQPGTCARIMTGAPVPAGADAVVMREDVDEADRSQVVVRGRARKGQHIRRAGEEIAAGALVLKTGTILTPGHLGLLASLGMAEVTVARRPRVALVATGDELVEPGQTLGPGEIHASNTVALAGWIAAAGAEPVNCGIAPDTLDGTRQLFARALASDCDMLISTGGVSVGDFDVVKDALDEVGVAMDFWKVAVKPGKPLAFGTIAGKAAFGLPGNPVSCQVAFLQFVRPVLRRSLGDPRPFLPVVKAQLLDGFVKRPGRAELVRVTLAWDRDGRLQARTTGSQSSGQSSSVAMAHGLALMAADGVGVPAGDSVSVQVYDWSFGTGAEPAYEWAGA